MTYRNPRQSLEEPTRSVVYALEPLQAVIGERLKCTDEWSDEHIDDLLDLQADLSAMQVRLRRLMKDNW